MIILKYKGFIAGFITATIVTSFSYAATVEKQITAYFKDSKIYVDGKLANLRDSNGEAVEPFVYNDTTYLPIRSIAEALNKKVHWDPNTDSVYIGEMPKVTVQTVVVTNTEELIRAIGPNKKIVLRPGKYNLTEAYKLNIDNPNISFENVFDGVQLAIKDVYNLSLIGAGNTPAEIQAEPRYANVLSFINSNAITIYNIKAGHTPDKGACTGGVLYFENSEDIKIQKSVLYGSGTEGITLNNVSSLDMSDSVINECTNSIMTINNSKNINFSGSKFVKNKEFDLINIFRSENILFDNCDISNNSTGFTDEVSEYYRDESLFNVDASRNIKVKDSVISNNTTQYFQKRSDSILLENTKLENNNFKKGESLH